MGESLSFPRVIYRGAADTLGQGPFTHPETGALVGETRRCEDQSEWEAAQKEGWRLTREEPSVDDAAADAAAGKKKK